ncbi:protein PHTF2 isoform X2 [Nematostella vectensis]|uniref:protein PHTF2 isoform X2 n=1 Tax=Nematostella vectensis TaxID=45351 RepID=UPI0020771DBB|nr:protein PHTF2 isoform X2 [Nematostella vectensis]
MDLDRNLSWFHRKLGRYDKASWERTFEEQEQEQSSLQITKKPGSLKPELIDVDLVVGSTFHKAKPVHTWLAVARKGIIRVILYPFYHQWWKQQTSTKLFFVFLFLYFCEILVLIVYLTDYESRMKVVSWTEAYGPGLMMILLGMLHFHLVSTDHSENIRRRRKTKHIKKRRSSRTKRQSSCERDKAKNGLIENVASLGVNCTTVRRRNGNSNLSDQDMDALHDSRSAEMNGSVPTQQDQEHDGYRSEDEDSESSDSTDSTSESDVSEMVMESTNEEDPFAWDKKSGDSDVSIPPPPIAERVMVSVWEVKQLKKAQMTLMEISAVIAAKVEAHKGSNGYIHFSCFVSVVLALVPLLFRLNNTKDVLDDSLGEILCVMFGYSAWSRFIVAASIFERIILSFSFFFLLCVAERSYRERCLYAKLFGWLTSSRKARRAGLPHFRLHKVRNIKTWLSLRSLLKRRGPQRSVDMIVSSSFVLGISLVIIMCVQLVKGSEKERFLSLLFNWEVSVWCLVLSLYVGYGVYLVLYAYTLCATCAWFFLSTWGMGYIWYCTHTLFV